MIQKPHGLIDMMGRFLRVIFHLRRYSVVGCGNGWVERELSDLGIGKKFDAFDISEDSHRDGKKAKRRAKYQLFPR